MRKASAFAFLGGASLIVSALLFATLYHGMVYTGRLKMYYHDENDLNPLHADRLTTEVVGLPELTLYIATTVGSFVFVVLTLRRIARWLQRGSDLISA